MHACHGTTHNGQVYQNFAHHYQAAKRTIQSRDANMNAVVESLESDMELVGLTELPLNRPCNSHCQPWHPSAIWLAMPHHWPLPSLGHNGLGL